MIDYDPIEARRTRAAAHDAELAEILRKLDHAWMTCAWCEEPVSCDAATEISPDAWVHPEPANCGEMYKICGHPRPF